MRVTLGQSSTPPKTRIYAIGDVHGHIDLLRNLHSAILSDLTKNPVENHKIIFIGDYIDRGPDSAACTEYLSNLIIDNTNAICLKGNHEAKLLDFLTDPISVADSFFTYGGVETATSYGVDMSDYNGTVDEKTLKSNELSKNIPAHHKIFYLKLPTTVTFGDYMFTHAGVRPGVPLDQQTDDDLIWIRYDFISHQEPYDKVIIHGHTPSYPMVILPNRINVDTHAYHTGVLSCIVLEGTDYRAIET